MTHLIHVYKSNKLIQENANKQKVQSNTNNLIAHTEARKSSERLQWE